jgi:cytosine/adenosine deaminase-related metal-dependent hydrolase
MGPATPWYRGDVAVRGETIVRIAPQITEPAGRVIDATGQIVAPGFIDVHSHGAENIFEVPTADNYIRQGVTTLFWDQMADPRFRSGPSWPSSTASPSRSTRARLSGRDRCGRR